MPPFRPFPSLLLLVLAASGCGPKGTDERPLTVDTLTGGITSVNSAAPLEAGRWSVVLEREVQPTEGEPGELIAPTDLALDDNGTLYVVESKPSAINVYDPGGRYVRTIGGRGSGPGEFSTGYIALRDSLLVLHDPVQARSTVYDAGTGRVASIRPTTCCYFGQVGIDAAGRAMARMMSPPDSTGHPEQWFIRFPIGANGLDTVRVAQDPALTDQPRWIVKRPGGGILMSTPVAFTPRAHEVSDPTGGLVTGFAGTYRLRRTSDGRDTVMLFGRTLVPTPITDDEKRAVIEQRIARQRDEPVDLDEAQLREAFDPSKIPSSRPAFEQVYVDGSGRVWVRQSSADTTAVHFDLFGTDGRWLDEVRIPVPAWVRNPYTAVSFSRDHVAILDEEDPVVTSIRVYRITRSEK